MNIQPFHIGLLVCAAIVFWRIVAALRSGRVWATRIVCYTRDEKPGAFWSILVLQLVITLGLVWLAGHSTLAKRPTEAAKIYAVTAAVREQLPKGKTAEFRNVRMDAKSGFVCGELTLKGSRLRFFGNHPEEKARSTPEQHKRPDFEVEYARVCGGKWVPPRTR